MTKLDKFIDKIEQSKSVSSSMAFSEIEVLRKAIDQLEAVLTGKEKIEKDGYLIDFLDHITVTAVNLGSYVSDWETLDQLLDHGDVELHERFNPKD